MRPPEPSHWPAGALVLAALILAAMLALRFGCAS
jgi:hypothetical protein